MGESKRRKMLDPNYGKSKIPQATLNFIGDALKAILEHGLTAVLVCTPKSYDVYATYQTHRKDILFVNFEDEKAITTNQLKMLLLNARLVLQIRSMQSAKFQRLEREIRNKRSIEIAA